MIARCLLSACLLIVISGCETIISPPPASQLYALSPLEQQLNSTPPLPANLIVSRPVASPGLEREFITLIKPDHQMSYYARARWTAPVPEMVRFFLIDSLQNQNRFQSVTPDTRFTGQNYRLDVHIQDFQADYRNTSNVPAINLRLAFTLTDLSNRKLLTSFVEHARIPVEDNRLGLVVNGFQSALEDVTSSAVQKINGALETASIGSSP